MSIQSSVSMLQILLQEKAKNEIYNKLKEKKIPISQKQAFEAAKIALDVAQEYLKERLQDDYFDDF